MSKFGGPRYAYYAFFDIIRIVGGSIVKRIRWGARSEPPDQRQLRGYDQLSSIKATTRWTWPSGPPYMPGWTVSGSHYVSWIGPTNPFHGLTASDGSYFLDLTGYIFGAPFSGVSQTIPTQAGANYLLTFDLGSDPFWGLQDGVSVSAGSVAGSVFTSTNSGTQNNLWQAESLSFAATGSSTTISLIGNSGGNYIGLDNVSVVQTSRTSSGVPEPSTWVMMLVGFGGPRLRGLSQGDALRLAHHSSVSSRCRFCCWKGTRTRHVVGRGKSTESPALSGHRLPPFPLGGC